MPISVNQTLLNVLTILPITCFQSVTSILSVAHCIALHLNLFHLWLLYYDPPLSPSLFYLHLSHCLYVCLALSLSLGRGPRALCAAMNDSSPSVVYVLGLENKEEKEKVS